MRPIGVALFAVSSLVAAGCSEHRATHNQGAAPVDTASTSARVQYDASIPAAVRAYYESGIRFPAAAESTVATARAVESFRVHPYARSANELDGTSYGKMGDFFLTARGPVLTRAQRRTAIDLVLNPASYEPFDLERDKMKLCGGFEPRHALRFRTDEHTADLLVCFACSELLLFEDGEWVGGGTFSPMKKELHALLEEVLPKVAIEEPN